MDQMDRTRTDGAEVKFDEAKQLGTMVNAARNQMNAIKAQLEQSQIGRAMDQMDRTRTDGADRVGDDGVNGMEGEEERLRNEIEREKALYRTHYLALKNIKMRSRERRHCTERIISHSK